MMATKTLCNLATPLTPNLMVGYFPFFPCSFCSCPNGLAFPAKHTPTSGPFVFAALSD